MRPDGDDGDFASWVQPHLLAMTRLAARLAPAGDGDDVVQEALVRAWQRRETYDPGRGSAQAWLLALVADKARRACGRRPVAPSRAAAPGAGPADPEADVALDVEADVDLERAVRALPPRQRLAVELHYFLDLPVRDTAAAMGCSDGTVKSTLSDARGALGRALREVAR